MNRDPHTSGIFSLPQIPVFRPSPSDFQDVWSYVLKIQSTLSYTGVCIVEPPDAVWDKDLTSEFAFGFFFIFLVG